MRKSEISFKYQRQTQWKCDDGNISTDSNVVLVSVRMSEPPHAASRASSNQAVFLLINHLKYNGNYKHHPI